MQKRLWFIVITVLLTLAWIAPAAAQDDSEEDEPMQSELQSQFAGSPDLAAPEFPDGLDWLNVEAPLSMEDDLRGKIVVLDFWTYGCINCIHMIPTLQRLEEKYPDELVVIGVHSAKFENEGETDNIRQIVQRYDMHHPVINDSDFLVWRTFGVQAWPTFVIIDPRGNVLARQGGEIPFEAFDNVISGMIDTFDPIGEINRDPIDVSVEGADRPATALRFPGKVLADTDGNRLFIADSSNHRIVIADLTSYEVQQVVGTGEAGWTDGAFDEAQFNQPQGMTLSEDGSTLYVADVKNHLIRQIDLAAGEVSTIAGTGEMGRGILRYEVVAPALQVPLRSPWDVQLDSDGETLYVAMAGTHQLWSMNLENETITPFVGNGREALLNDTLADSELAQPSGLYLDGRLLYFADSESSTIRVADLAADEVRTVSGTAENSLFDFGDVDGVVGESRLQHALGVTGTPDGTIWIADTYNSKIKRVDAETGETITVFGEGGLGGFRDGGVGEAQFDEPGGLDYADGRIYVADTNNHTVRVIDVENLTVSTITFPNPEALQIGERTTVVGGNSALGMEIALDAQTVAPGRGEVVVNLNLPEGYKINELAPSSAEVFASGEGVFVADENSRSEITDDNLPLRVPVTLTEGDDLVQVNVTAYYCEAENTSLCFIEDVGISLPVTVEDGAEATTLDVQHDIPLPEVTVGTEF